MALNVSYKNRLGYFTLKGDDGASWKIHFCRANAMCAMMYFYREVKDGKRHDMVRLWGFFCDAKHAKACIDDGFFRNCTGFTFISKNMSDRTWQLVKTMTKCGIKVAIK